MKNNRTITAIIISSVVFTTTLFADSFSGQLTLEPNWVHSKLQGASTVRETFADFVDWTHTTGTNANQMNVIVRETTTLTNSQSRTLNLSGGVSDSFGDVSIFQTVRFFCVTCPSTNTNNLSVGNASSNQWAAWAGATNDTLTVRPGGSMILIAPDATGYAVTTNACNLSFTNLGTNSIIYSSYIGGAE